MQDPTSLTLLEEAGPFESAVYRATAVALNRDWTDVSFGTRLADETRVAIALIRRRATCDSVPPGGYGSICADRELTEAEIQAVLDDARLHAGARDIRVRTVAIDGGENAGARTIGYASVVPIDAAIAPDERYARVARRSMRKAVASGCEVRTTAVADGFLALYREASKEWRVRYPEQLLVALAERGAARCDEVHLEGDVVAALYTVLGTSHWMCWLAAQAEQGRRTAASYLAYANVFEDARSRGVRAVNLGASVRGGAEFKAHLGAVERPICEWARLSRLSSLRDSLSRSTT